MLKAEKQSQNTTNGGIQGGPHWLCLSPFVFRENNKGIKRKRIGLAGFFLNAEYPSFHLQKFHQVLSPTFIFLLIMLEFKGYIVAILKSLSEYSIISFISNSQYIYHFQLFSISNNFQLDPEYHLFSVVESLVYFSPLGMFAPFW